MTSAKLFDTTTLKKAIASLEIALRQHAAVPDDLFVRDACIQRFEYTYELSGKLLRRYLETTEMNPTEVKAMSFADLIRTASVRGLLYHDWSQWKQYREKRNITSHTYHEQKAMEVLAILPNFLQDAQYLLNKLAEKTKA